MSSRKSAVFVSRLPSSSVPGHTALKVSSPAPLAFYDSSCPFCLVGITQLLGRCLPLYRGVVAMMTRAPKTGAQEGTVFVSWVRHAHPCFCREEQTLSPVLYLSKHSVPNDGGYLVPERPEFN